MFATSDGLYTMKISKSKLAELKQSKIRNDSEKEADNLLQLMTLPDYDVLEFMQQLRKGGCEEEVLTKLSHETKVDFFSKRYMRFLETQEELLELKMPELQEVEEAKEFKTQIEGEGAAEEDFEQSSVLEMIDCLGSAVAERDESETMRYLGMVQQMRKHSKFQKYFDRYSISKLFLETYNSFLQNCTSYEQLVSLGEVDQAMRLYLKQQQDALLSPLRTNVALNDSSASLAKQMTRLVQGIRAQVQKFRQTFGKYHEKSEEMSIVSCEWVAKLVRSYYMIVEEHIYAKEELADILKSLGAIVEAAGELDTKGFSIGKQLRDLIAADLPAHIAKVVEIIVDSVSQVLAQDQQLYQFVHFSSVRRFASDLQKLKRVQKEDFGVKCATTKGIILVNAFSLILECVCEDRWLFLQQGVLQTLLSRVASNILSRSLHFWDHYYIYLFFDRLAAGKVRHKHLLSGDIPLGIREKLSKFKQLSQEAWGQFESKLTMQFFNQVLKHIPGQLYAFKKYGYQLDKHDPRPSTFSISIVFGLQAFLRQLQFRVSSSQLALLSVVLFELITYTIEFVLFWAYHAKGTNTKVFSLHSKQTQLFNCAFGLPLLQIDTFKQGKILNLSRLNRHGFTKFAFEVYFMADVIKSLTGTTIEAQPFLKRVSQVMARDQKAEPIDVPRGPLEETLAKILRVFKQKPEMMRSYLNDRKSRE